MAWQGRHVVVTGAGGFIGSHLTETLMREGAQVTAIVRYNSRQDDGNLRFLAPDVRRRLTIHRIDLNDVEATRQALAGAEVVFHLAAFVGIPYSYANPHDTVMNNVQTTLNVLGVARELGVRRLVQTSTSEVYGSAQFVPITEQHPLQPQSPYSASKIATDHIALSYHYAFGLPVTIVRPFNTFGPRQSARAVIPAVIAQALTQDELKVGSTTTTRDFTFVADTVRGFLLAAEASRAVGQVVNLGTGREVGISAMIEMVVKLVGRPVRLVRDEARVRPETSEVSRLCADIARAGELIGYAPQVPFEEGLARTIEWIRANIDVYRPDMYVT